MRKIIARVIEEENGDINIHYYCNKLTLAKVKVKLDEVLKQ